MTSRGGREPPRPLPPAGPSLGPRRRRSTWRAGVVFFAVILLSAVWGAESLQFIARRVDPFVGYSVPEALLVAALVLGVAVLPALLLHLARRRTAAPAAALGALAIVAAIAVPPSRLRSSAAARAAWQVLNHQLAGALWVILACSALALLLIALSGSRRWSRRRKSRGGRS